MQMQTQHRTVFAFVALICLVGPAVRADLLADGTALLESEEYFRAEQTLKLAMEDPGSADLEGEIAYQLCRSLIRQGKREEFESLLASHSGDGGTLRQPQIEELLVEMGRADLEEHRDATARAEMLDFVASNPQSAKVIEARFVASKSQFHMGRYHLTRTKELGPESEYAELKGEGRSRLRIYRDEAAALLEDGATSLTVEDRDDLRISIYESMCLEGLDGELENQATKASGEELEMIRLAQAKAAYDSEDYAEAERLCRQFGRDHAGSRFAGEACYYKLKSMFITGRTHHRAAERARGEDDESAMEAEFQVSKEKLSMFRLELAQALGNSQVPERHVEKLKGYELKALYFEEEFDQYCALLDESNPDLGRGSPSWGWRQINHGIALAMSDPPQHERGLEYFTRVVEADPLDYGEIERLKSNAAFWQIYVASCLNQETLVAELVLQAYREMPDSETKKQIIHGFGHLLPEDLKVK